MRHKALLAPLVALAAGVAMVLSVPTVAAPSPAVGTLGFTSYTYKPCSPQPCTDGQLANPGTYGEWTSVVWTFTGTPSRYPRLNLLMTCWAGDKGGATGVQGYPAGADIVYSSFAYIPSSQYPSIVFQGPDGPYLAPGAHNFQPGNPDYGTSRWDSMPGDKWCNVVLGDWTTKQTRNQVYRKHAEVGVWLMQDPRVP